MARTILIQVGVFLIPFAIYAIFMLMKRQNPFTGAAWTGTQVALLSGVGLVLTVLVFTLLVQNAGLHLSGRNPAGDAAQQVRPVAR
jgi:hypothetical protein